MTRDSAPRNGGPASKPPVGRAVAIVVIAAAMGFGAIYAMARTLDNAGIPEAPLRTAPTLSPRLAEAPPAGPAPLPAGPGSNALSVGEMAAFVFKKAPEALPEFGFVDGTGRERSLKDWRGKVVLLNLWATWCLPCRKEMPGLERLQAELGSDKFEVVAVSVDRTGIEGAKKFLDGIKIEKLGVFADPSVRAGSTLKVIGMPGTLLVDREGREIGRLIGPAEWDSADAKNLIKAAIR